MDTLATVQVPVEDAGELDALGTLSDGEEVEIVHPFDGGAVAQVVITLSTAALPFFKSWMDARVKARKSFEFRYKGRRFKGATADDVIKILKAIE
jgi:hypothetical protein